MKKCFVGDCFPDIRFTDFMLYILLYTLRFCFMESETLYGNSISFQSLIDFNESLNLKDSSNVSFFVST